MFYYEGQLITVSYSMVKKACQWCKSIGKGYLPLYDGIQLYLDYQESLIP